MTPIKLAPYDTEFDSVCNTTNYEGEGENKERLYQQDMPAEKGRKQYFDPNSHIFATCSH
jgi:hypothetical protein